MQYSQATLSHTNVVSLSSFCRQVSLVLLACQCNKNRRGGGTLVCEGMKTTVQPDQIKQNCREKGGEVENRSAAGRFRLYMCTQVLWLNIIITCDTSVDLGVI